MEKEHLSFKFAVFTVLMAKVWTILTSFGFGKEFGVSSFNFQVTWPPLAFSQIQRLQSGSSAHRLKNHNFHAFSCLSAFVKSSSSLTWQRNV